MSKGLNGWILLTAGLGDGPIRQASDRLIKQARKLYDFKQSIVLTRENIESLCPETFSKYRKELRTDIRGYGYFSWKSELVARAIRQEFGPCDGVVWLDSGCEANSNFLSRIVFRYLLKKAIRSGGWFYSLKTPEICYTKQDVILQFPNAQYVMPERQVQANFFIVSQPKGMLLTSLWSKYVLEDLHHIDFAKSSEGEKPEFIEHRNDQSILSLAVKSLGCPISKWAPTSRPSSWYSRVRAIVNPIWIARNRTGQSIRERTMK